MLQDTSYKVNVPQAGQKIEEKKAIPLATSMPVAPPSRATGIFQGSGLLL
jgi:hypothetical protein